MVEVHLGLGSNLGDRQKYLDSAISELEKNGVSILKTSSILETEPLGGLDQPKYLNIVLKVETELSPQELLKTCQKIEDKLGRVRAEKWASRTIDIDILFYGDEKIKSKNLTIPHPDVYNRYFWQQGLNECGDAFL